MRIVWYVFLVQVRLLFAAVLLSFILGVLPWCREAALLASAQSGPVVRIRALLPQPSTGKPEWVLLEREDSGTATFSATLRDTHGSTKAYTWMWEEDRLWYQLTATQSGIALNNDQDGVTLEVNGMVVDSSVVYTPSERDVVWTRVSTGWQWLALSEFEERRETSNWTLVPSQTGTPTPSTAASFHHDASSAPSSFASDVVSRSATVTETKDHVAGTPYPGKAIVLNTDILPLGTESASRSTPIPFVEPDYAGEQARYQSWLLWWRRALGLFMGSAVCWWSLVIVQAVKRVKRRSSRRWGWSLLS